MCIKISYYVTRTRESGLLFENKARAFKAEKKNESSKGILGVEYRTEL